ncbi:MAG: hypothetical protein HYY45_16015 [Deltaproteobacteria bacterium]|nr:hypothetical protein [Deltaproteobacteria bacterium]
MRDMLLFNAQKIVPFLPGLAYAHGDDNVNATSFIGPLVGLLVFAAVVGLGRVFLRWIIEKV